MKRSQITGSVMKGSCQESGEARSRAALHFWNAAP
jgi:hypothetical protein